MFYATYTQDKYIYAIDLSYAFVTIFTTYVLMIFAVQLNHQVHPISTDNNRTYLKNSTSHYTLDY